MAAFLGWGEERARDLVAFGGVYYKPAAAPATAKPKRELDPERQGLCEGVSPLPHMACWAIFSLSFFAGDN